MNELPFLIIGSSRSLAGGPVDQHDVIALLIHQAARQLLRLRQINRALSIERGHHGSREPAEHWLSHGTMIDVPGC